MRRHSNCVSLILLTIVLFCTAVFGQITPIGDSYTNTANSTTNYGAKTLLNVDGATQITYIQFNLASIPSTASVSQAALKLYVNTVVQAGSFNVDYVNDAWNESTIDASNAPVLGANIASDVAITSADKNQYILINVTSAVQAWLKGSEANNGIALVANGSFNGTFDSKENTTTSHPPELDLAFAGGDGTITGVTTASGSGLTGGGKSGTLSLALTNACGANQVLQWNGSSWICAAVGTGTITGVTAGTDLTGGGTSGNVILDLNTSALNSVYPQLAANNIFTGVQTINNTTVISGANSSGVLQVTNTLTSGTAPGVNATTDSTSASPLRGNAVATTGTSNGVFGNSASADGYGVYGQVQGSSSTEIFGSGVWGDTGGPAESFLSGVSGTADDNSGGSFYNSSGSDTTTPALYAYNGSSNGEALVFQAGNGDSGGICEIKNNGNLNCSGTVGGVVKADGGLKQVSVHAVQSPENWFEDFGSATLTNGAATVALDPTFASTVNTMIDYHVFLTPNGDCNGLYVGRKSANSFEVRELAGGKSNVAFDYRIVAKRAGYENQRLEDVTERARQMQQKQQLRRERSAQRRASHAGKLAADHLGGQKIGALAPTISPR